MTEHDDDLHDPRLTALYRRKDGEQPPAHLDAAIRKAAHAVVKRPASRRLWPSLATAALLVLGVSVALMVFDQPQLDRPAFDRSDPEQRSDEAARREEKTAPAEAPPAASFGRPAAQQPKVLGKALPASPVPAIRSFAAEGQATTPQATGRADSALSEAAEPMPADADADGPVPSHRRDAVPSDDCSAFGDLARISEADLNSAIERVRLGADPTAVRCLEQALQALGQRP